MENYRGNHVLLDGVGDPGSLARTCSERLRRGTDPSRQGLLLGPGGQAQLRAGICGQEISLLEYCKGPCSEGGVMSPLG